MRFLAPLRLVASSYSPLTPNAPGTSAKIVLRDFMSSPRSSAMSSLIQHQSSSTPSEEGVNLICAQVINDLPKEVAKIKAGQNKVLMRLVGEVMKRSGGGADAKRVAVELRELLG